MLSITESCKCGAEVNAPSTYGSLIESFRVQHAPCLQQPVQQGINEQVVEVLSTVQLALEHLRLRIDILSAKVDAHEHAILTLNTEGSPNGPEADS